MNRVHMHIIGELMPQECFVEFCIPESAITDIEARFPNRTY